LFKPGLPFLKRVYAFLESLKLSAHPDKRYIGKTEKGFDFLGYTIYPNPRLRPSAVSFIQLIERSRRLQEKGADLHRLLEYVERWVIWLHGGLQGAVGDNRFSQIWTYVNEKLLHNP